MSEWFADTYMSSIRRYKKDLLVAITVWWVVYDPQRRQTIRKDTHVKQAQTLHPGKRRLISSSRELVIGVLDTVLDPEQDGRLPLIKLAHLVILEQFFGEQFLVPGLDCLDKVNQQLVLPLGGE